MRLRGGDEWTRQAENSEMGRDDEVELVNNMIDKAINRNQSVAEHNLRIKDMRVALTECEEGIRSIRSEQSENDWEKFLRGNFESDLNNFCYAQELVYALVEKVIEGCEAKRDLDKLIVRGGEGNKRRREPDCDDQETPGDKRTKSTNLQSKKSATPKIKRNLQNAKNTTTPSPISSFLSKFNFKTKKPPVDCGANSKKHSTKNNPEIEIKNELKSEKEIFMSKFNKIKNVFEKENVKKKSTVKVTTTPKTKKVEKLTSKYYESKKVNLLENYLLKGKVAPPELIPRKETTTEYIQRKVDAQAPPMRITKQACTPTQETPPTTKTPTTTKQPPTKLFANHNHSTLAQPMIPPKSEPASKFQRKLQIPGQPQPHAHHVLQQPPLPTTTTNPPYQEAPEQLSPPTHPIPSVDMKRFPSNLCEPQGTHRVQLRYGGTNIVPPGTTLRNVALCAGLNTPSNVNTNQPQPPPPRPPTPAPAPTQSISNITDLQDYGYHHPPPPPTPLQQDVTKPTCRTAQEQHEGLLQGKVVPQPVNRLTKLRKIFELDSGEDNPIGKKTTFTMIRESGTEKKKMKTKGDSRKQDNSEDVKFSVEDNIRRRPGSLPASVDNCVSSGTDNTTAVHSSCATPQIEKSKQIT